MPQLQSKRFMAMTRNEGQAAHLYDEAVRLAARLTPLEGYNETLVSDVTVLRRSKSSASTPVVYEPSIIIVVQGKKVDSLGVLKVAYDPKTMLVLSAPMPFQCVVQANQNKPLLSVVVRLRREVVLSIVAGMQDSDVRQIHEPKAILTVALEEEVLGALVRLLKTALSRNDAQVLGEQTVRELIYLVLKGPGGDGVRAMVDVGGVFAHILSALQRIHRNYNHSLQVADLARRAGMSVSAFHAHFKRVTGTSPIQYIKTVRMHRARVLLLRPGSTAASVGASVGYKSASQFGRDYRRAFGKSPSKDKASDREERTNKHAGHQARKRKPEDGRRVAFTAPLARQNGAR